MLHRRSLAVLVGLAAVCLFASVPAMAVPSPRDGPALSAPTPAAPVVLQQQQKPKDNGDITVYATKTGKRYHKAGCSSLRKSSIPMKLRDAVAAGLTPCGNCHPPVLQQTTK